MKIVVTDKLSDAALAKLRGAGEVVHQPAELDKELADASVLVVRSATEVTPEMLAKAPNLKIVFRAGVGLDNIDVKACEEKGIRVMNTPGASTNAVAEFTIGSMIALMHGIAEGNHKMKEGEWAKKKLMGRELSGKTLGILGCGRIGLSVAEKAFYLGMRVLGHTAPPKHETSYLTYVELDKLLSESDVITLHVPLIPETKNMINNETIAKMKGGVYLIDAARGGVVDEEALYEALRSGKVAGAALDVFAEEPYTGKLLGLENVVLTPHIGGSTYEAQERIGELMAEVLKQEGKELGI